MTTKKTAFTPLLINRLIADTTIRIAALQESEEAFRAAMKARYESIFKHEIARILEWFPTIKTIEWTQYTPWWNDGDPCTFSVHDPEINGHAKWAWRTIREAFKGAHAEREWAQGAVKDHREELEAGVNYEQVFDFLGAFGHDCYLSMFGDHAKVVITRDGITVEEYSHD